MISFQKSATQQRVEIIDLHPETGDILAETLAGLSAKPKTLPCKYFYDALGARLFEAITELPEYYLTRTELQIMNDSVAEMAAAIGPHATLVEFGSGVGQKVQGLLAALHKPVGCVLIDISRQALESSTEVLGDRFEELSIVGVCADYTESFEMPRPRGPSARTVAYFPGSTIGNFTFDQASRFLRRVRELVGEGGGLLIGLDRRKDPSILEPAYNDPLGATGAFNLNILRRLNILGADFNLAAFRHRAPYNVERGRIEMNLVSQVAQTVRLAGSEVQFHAGESILTEYSHKYDLEQVHELARSAGFEMTHEWSDAEQWFSVCFLQTS